MFVGGVDQHRSIKQSGRDRFHIHCVNDVIASDYCTTVPEVGGLPHGPCVDARRQLGQVRFLPHGCSPSSSAPPHFATKSQQAKSWAKSGMHHLRDLDACLAELDAILTAFAVSLAL
jgi:hypothetical protein